MALFGSSLLVSVALAELAVRALGLDVARFGEARHLESPDKRIGVDVYPLEGQTPGLPMLHLRDGNDGSDAEREQTRMLLAALPELADGISRAPLAAIGHYSAEHCRVATADAELPPVDPNRLRLLFVGDSFTEGQGVAFPATAPVRLGATLGRDDLDIVNCGRRGYDFPALADFIDAHLTASPELVVYAMNLNDAERGAAFAIEQHYVDDWIMDRRRMLGRGMTAPAPSAFRLFAVLRDRWESAQIGAATLAWYAGMYTDANADGWGRTLEQLEAIRDRIQAQGGRLLVALWPILTGLETHYPLEETHVHIAAALRRHGLEFIDTLPCFRGTASETLWVHQVDHHPNARAQDLFAQCLRAPILERLDTMHPRTQP